MLLIRFIHPWRSFAVGHQDEYPLGVADLYIRMGLAVAVVAGTTDPPKGGKRVRPHKPDAARA